MQRASMLGVGPVQGIRTNPALLSNNPQVGVVSGLSSRTYHQQFLQPQQQSVFEQLGSSQQGKMDDLFEQMFSLPSWPETGGMSRAPWDYNAAGSANAMSVEAAGSLPGPQKLFTMSLMPSAMPGSSTGSQGLSSRNREMQDNINNHPQADEGAQYSFDDSLIATRLQQQQRGLQDALVGSTTATAGQQQMDIRATTLSQANQEAAQNSMRRLSEGMTATGPVALQLNTGNPLAGNTSVSQVLAAVAGSARATGLVRSPSVGSSVSEASGVQQPLTDGQAGPPVAPMWRQPYTGGVLPLPLNVGQAKAEAFLSREGTSNDAHLLGKRSRDDEEARAGPQENLFNSFVGQMGQSQTARTAGQQSHQQMQSGHGVSVPPYASHTGLAQPQGAAAVVAGTARPRVRARRGQATDPHSIAERLRRERIAERMKALQDLVPNSNKTDKASMLDEIIEYVKFLQLQVKVLSMSRLGGAGAVAPLVADRPAEGQNNFVATLGRSGGASGPSQDGMVATERQVARLMEENMGSAMQFLQGKGLCLMPISLATAISSTNPRPPTGPQGGVQGLASGDHPRLDASSSTPASSSSTVASGVMVSSSNSGDGVGNDPASKGGSGAVRSSKDSIQASAADKVNGVGSGLPASGAKSGIKSNEEASRRAP